MNPLNLLMKILKNTKLTQNKRKKIAELKEEKFLREMDIEVDKNPRSSEAEFKKELSSYTWRGLTKNTNNRQE